MRICFGRIHVYPSLPLDGYAFHGSRGRFYKDFGRARFILHDGSGVRFFHSGYNIAYGIKSRYFADRSLYCCGAFPVHGMDPSGMEEDHAAYADACDDIRAAGILLPDVPLPADSAVF